MGDWWNLFTEQIHSVMIWCQFQISISSIVKTIMDVKPFKWCYDDVIIHIIENRNVLKNRQAVYPPTFSRDSRQVTNVNIVKLVQRWPRLTDSSPSQNFSSLRSSVSQSYLLSVLTIKSYSPEILSRIFRYFVEVV